MATIILSTVLGTSSACKKGWLWLRDGGREAILKTLTIFQAGSDESWNWTGSLGSKEKSPDVGGVDVWGENSL